MTKTKQSKKPRRRLNSARSVGSNVTSNSINNKKVSKRRGEDITIIDSFDSEEHTGIGIPNSPFCTKCKNSEIRGYKDTISHMLATINMVAIELGIDSINWKTKCKKLREWARKRMVVKSRKKVGENAKES